MRLTMGITAGLFLTGLPVFASQIYAISYDNRFGVVNDVTGAYTQISTLPDTLSYGIAYDQGTMYVQSSGGGLIRVDPASGAASVVGSSGLQSSTAVFGGGNNGLYEIDFASNLYSINPTTGAATKIGATGLAANNGGWETSLSSDGTSLYFTMGAGAGSVDELYRINTATGKATDLGSTGVRGIAGSAYVNGNLELYQYHWDSETNYIYSAVAGSVSFTAGPVLATKIIDGGVVAGKILTESAIIPEPATFVQFGIGLAILAAFAVRRQALAKRVFALVRPHHQ